MSFILTTTRQQHIKRVSWAPSEVPLHAILSKHWFALMLMARVSLSHTVSSHFFIHCAQETSLCLPVIHLFLLLYWFFHPSTPQTFVFVSHMRNCYVKAKQYSFVVASQHFVSYYQECGCSLLRIHVMSTKFSQVQITSLSSKSTNQRVVCIHLKYYKNKIAT